MYERTTKISHSADHLLFLHCVRGPVSFRHPSLGFSFGKRGKALSLLTLQKRWGNFIGMQDNSRNVLHLTGYGKLSAEHDYLS